MNYLQYIFCVNITLSTKKKAYKQGLQKRQSTIFAPTAQSAVRTSQALGSLCNVIFLENKVQNWFPKTESTNLNELLKPKWNFLVWRLIFTFLHQWCKLLSPPPWSQQTRLRLPDINQNQLRELQSKIRTSSGYYITEKK